MSGWSCGKLVMSVDIKGGRIRTKLCCLHSCSFILRVWMYGVRMWMYFLLEECLIEHVRGRLLRNLSMKLVDKVLVNNFLGILTPFKTFFLYTCVCLYRILYALHRFHLRASEFPFSFSLFLHYPPSFPHTAAS